MTTIYADTDYVVDQVFWQHVGTLHDRLDAQDFATIVDAEAAQVLHLGEELLRADPVRSWSVTDLASEMNLSTLLFGTIKPTQ